MCSFLVWKNACLKYREFDLENDLVGVPHTLPLKFILLLKKESICKQLLLQFYAPI